MHVLRMHRTPNGGVMDLCVDYRLSVEGLKAAAPDLRSTPTKGVIKKTSTRSATKAGKKGIDSPRF